MREKYRKTVNILSCVSVCLFAMTAVLLIILIYLDGTNAKDETVFSPERVARYAPYALIPLVLMIECCVLYGIYGKKNRHEYVPSELNGMKKWKYGTPVMRRVSAGRVVVVPLFCGFLALTVIGILTGGMDYVLKKAVAICSECIGLG